MQSKQSHANTPRHDDPCDDWKPIGDYIRAEVARVRKAIDAQRQLEDEFCDADAAYVLTYTRFRG